VNNKVQQNQNTEETTGVLLLSNPHSSLPSSYHNLYIGWKGVPQESTIVAIKSLPPIEKKVVHKRRPADDIYFGENCWLAIIICRSWE
jgi:hypothetical protein